MIQVRRKGTGSWLDHTCARAVAAKLSTRLIQRCKGERGVMVTLTYRRNEYDDSRDLYRTARERQHVPLFLRKVERRIGESLKGQWLCKLEFQKGGWVHWHLVILGRSRLSIEMLRECWGHGHVWIDRMKPQTLTYLTKYIAKPGAIPPWIYGEPPRSVKIIRSSPGFWRNAQGAEEAEAVPVEDEDPYPYEHLEPEEAEPPRRARYLAKCYRCIGLNIEDAEIFRELVDTVRSM